MIRMTDEMYKANVVPVSVRLPIRGVHYHYNEWGDADAPLLVMLHGWGDTGSAFQLIMSGAVGAMATLPITREYLAHKITEARRVLQEEVVFIKL